MKRGMKRKLLSTILALCLVFTLLPMAVLANGGYAFTAPAPIEVNGVTATVSFGPESPQAGGSNVSATVTLSGTATVTALHSIKLTSVKAALNGDVQVERVVAGQDLTAYPITKSFHFTVPEENVDDLILTHTAILSTDSAAYFNALESESIIYENTSVQGVNDGPATDTTFVLAASHFITGIFAYHWNAAPDTYIGKTLSLRHADGTVYGPWPVSASEGQGGKQNVNWYAFPNKVLKTGTYTLVDSDNATWSWASDTGGKGICIVKGLSASQTVTDLIIEDAIAPINGEAPKTEIAETAQYTGTVFWDGDPETFAPDTAYTATITLEAKEGYTFDGIAADAFSVPCAATAANDADTGMITVTFWSPPSGYSTDGNGAMAYRYGASYGFDIYGTYDGRWMDTTCGSAGYGTKYILNGNLPENVSATGSAVDIGSDITIQIQPQFYGNGRFLRIVYTLHNASDAPATISFGSHADTQIGGDDRAPIAKFEDGRGFKMVNDSSYMGNMGAQFNFFGKGTIGVTDVDTFWFGYWSSRHDHVFTQVETDSFSGDSGMAYSWKDQTLAPGQMRTFSVLIGIGDAQSGENVPIGVNFDAQGGDDVDPITVEMAGDTVSAPTPPTRNGYIFGGWYTEPECTNPFDFATPITATVTLYAKWTPNELEVVFDSRGGGAVPPVTGLTAGATVSAPTPPTRNGYIFGGWYTEPECTNPFDFATPITATVTLYAKWTQDAPPSQYPVTDANQGERVGGQTRFNKELAEAGDTVQITVTPDKGYQNGRPIVLDGDKEPVAVTDHGDGTFSFQMPAGGVTVETEFMRIDYFDDVSGDDWYDGASWFCAAHDLMKGTGHRQFSGHIGASRAMLVTVLYRLANGGDGFESTFADVKDGKWYSEAIGWAAHHKIVKGYGNEKFGPHDTLTREQMVTILYRYSVFMKYDVKKADDLHAFGDAAAISPWALEAMKWAVGNGIVEGVCKDVLSPGTGGTRAQLAAMMQRYITTFIEQQNNKRAG